MSALTSQDKVRSARSRLPRDLRAVARIAHWDAATVRRVLRSDCPTDLKAVVWRVAVSQRWLEDRPFRVKTAYGTWFAGNSNDLISRMIYYFGVWEPAISRYVRASLIPGDVFVDVGANRGWYTTLAASCVTPLGKVVAIEASAPLMMMLSANVRLNHAENVVTVHAAAWHRSERLPIYAGPQGNLGKTSVLAESGRALPPSEFVSGFALSQLIPPDLWGRIRFVKIDVEGAEWEVACGLLGLLDNTPDSLELIMEINPELLRARGHDPEALLDIFRNRGYNVFKIPNEYHISFYIDSTGSRSQGSQRFEGPLQTQCDVLLSRRTGIRF